MTVNPVWHGSQFAAFPNEIAMTGGILNTGSFVATAASVTTVTDASVGASTRIIVYPANAAAGLVSRTNSCFVTTGAGSFTFTVSATGAGAPAGTELFNYIVLGT